MSQDEGSLNNDTVDNFKAAAVRQSQDTETISTQVANRVQKRATS